MANPVAVTIVEKLVTTDTSASSLVVGGASPVATTGTGGINSGAIVSSGNVSDSVGSMATIRAGGIGIASQAALDFIYASSATQLARLAKGTSLQYLRLNSGASAYEFGSIVPTLVKEGAGTSTTAAATNLDTFALASTLTIKDTLLVFTRTANTGSAANITVSLYNSTDSVTIHNLPDANNNYFFNMVVLGAQTATKVASAGIGTTANTSLRATFVTNWTGAWTLALRSAGITAPDTLEWEWAVYRIAGQ